MEENIKTSNQEEVILSVKDLRVSFRSYAGTVQAVRGISFELKKGETIAIVGESGSGKSVTTKSIMGILSKNAIIEQGCITYRDQDLTKINEQQFHEIRGKKIGLIFQDPMSALNPIMKIGKQITEVLLLNHTMTKKQAKDRAIALMEEVGIPEAHRRFDQYPFQFSGGMRQRIVIAIALANDPEVLICDEPTTALDVTVQAKILDLINKLKKEKNLSIVFITHDLGVVANIADRVYVMYAGKIVEYGLSTEIFFDPRHPYTWALLASMPDMQTKGKLLAIAGAPPNMMNPPQGDAFAARNDYAMEIDFKKEPPFFQISQTHYAATWLLDERAPKTQLPLILRERIDRMLAEEEAYNERIKQ
jgi:oligopeptide transport system ATP-binding protein